MILTSYTADEAELGRVEVYLADYREGTDPNILLDEWKTVDISGLNAGTAGLVAEIRIAFESTDVGDFGINTPTYVAMDDLVIFGGWAGYPLNAQGWANTGDFLGWVFPLDDYVWSESLNTWLFLPEAHLEAEAGAWAYVPR